MQIESWGLPKTFEGEVDGIIEELSVRRGEWALVGKYTSREDVIKYREAFHGKGAESKCIPDYSLPYANKGDFYAMMPEEARNG